MDDIEMLETEADDFGFQSNDSRDQYLYGIFTGAAAMGFVWLMVAGFSA